MISSALQLSAIRWWRSKKPIHWSLEDHLKQPAVNCKGEVEHELAEAIAELVRKKQQ